MAKNDGGLSNGSCVVYSNSPPPATSSSSGNNSHLQNDNNKNNCENGNNISSNINTAMPATNATTTTTTKDPTTNGDGDDATVSDKPAISGVPIDIDEDDDGVGGVDGVGGTTGTHGTTSSSPVRQHGRKGTAGGVTGGGTASDRSDVDDDDMLDDDDDIVDVGKEGVQSVESGGNALVFKGSPLYMRSVAHRVFINNNTMRSSGSGRVRYGSSADDSNVLARSMPGHMYGPYSSMNMSSSKGVVAHTSSTVGGGDGPRRTTINGFGDGATSDAVAAANAMTSNENNYDSVSSSTSSTSPGRVIRPPPYSQQQQSLARMYNRSSSSADLYERRRIQQARLDQSPSPSKNRAGGKLSVASSSITSSTAVPSSPIIARKEESGIIATSSSHQRSNSVADHDIPLVPQRIRLILTLPVYSHSPSEQDNRCFGCGVLCPPKTIGSSMRFCHYLGKYFCKNCHVNETFIIPGQVVTRWSFKRYPVSHVAYQYLESHFNVPNIDLYVANISLYNNVKALREVLSLRTRIRDLVEIITLCPSEHGDKLMNLLDLVDVDDKVMKQFLKKIIETYVKHVVEQCEYCKRRGKPCPACRSADLLYPFQSSTVYTCVYCGTMSHKKCWKRIGGRCPVCSKTERARSFTSFDSF